MKCILRSIAYILFLSLLPVAISAQTHTGGINKQNTYSKKQAAPVSNKQITVTVKNLAEKSVVVFAGPKVEIKNPKPRLKTLGGLSKNTVYVKVSDVVCLMNVQDKPTACTDIKLTTTLVEINASANGITAK